MDSKLNVHHTYFYNKKKVSFLTGFQLLKERILFRGDPFLAVVSSCKEAKKKSQEFFLFVKIVEKKWK